MDLTPRQQADAAFDALTPQQQFTVLHENMTFIESLELEQAPALTIDAGPDESGMSIQLIITGDEYLTAFKEVTVAALRKMSQKAATAIRHQGIPAGCTTSEMKVGNGMSVTIVHPPAHVPPIAYSEDEVQLD